MGTTRSMLIMSDNLDREQHEELAARAEAVGLSAVYHSELAYDVHVYEQLALMRTGRLRVGSAIAVRHKRHPVLAAETAATLDRLFPGRYVMGLGTGAAEPFSGVPEDRPVGRMDEYITIVRAVLSGGAVDFHGKFYDAVYGTSAADGTSGAVAPVAASHIPIYIAGGGHLSLRLAGRKADGVFIQHFGNRAVLSEYVASVRRAASEAGRDPASVSVSLLVQVCVDDDGERARDALRNYLAVYFEAPYYRRLLGDGGFPADAARIEQAWLSGGHDAAAAAISDEVLDACGVAGTPAEVHERFDHFVVDGIDDAVLYPSPLKVAGQSDDWFGMYCRILSTLSPEAATSLRSGGTNVAGFRPS